jgi:hypothetical protein
VPRIQQPPPIVWDWSLALLGALYAAPGVVLTLTDPTKGLALAVGVLPAAAFGIPGPRRARVVTVVLGVLIGASMTLGAFLAQFPIVAVPAIFALSVGAALIAPRGKLGRLGLGLCLPMVGIGLSFSDPAEAAGLGALMLAGSLYAYLVSLLWPNKPPPPGQPTATTPAAPANSSLDYGIRLGLAAAIAAGIGFALHLEHVGWACAAVLLVMRPAPDMVRSRGLDRTLSVLAGATAACLLILTTPTNPVLAGSVAVALTALAATHPSHRYLTPTFTTFVMFLLLLNGSPQDAEHRFLERLTETILGVGLALIFGVLVPRLRRQRRTVP